MTQQSAVRLSLEPLLGQRLGTATTGTGDRVDPTSPCGSHQSFQSPMAAYFDPKPKFFPKQPQPMQQPQPMPQQQPTAHLPNWLPSGSGSAGSSFTTTTWAVPMSTMPGGAVLLGSSSPTSSPDVKSEVRQAYNCPVAIYVDLSGLKERPRSK